MYIFFKLKSYVIFKTKHWVDVNTEESNAEHKFVDIIIAEGRSNCAATSLDFCKITLKQT